MGVLVRQVGYTSSNYPLVKRCQGTLNLAANGAFVVAQIVLDMNQAGITGAGGDGTGIPKIYLYTSNDGPDHLVWTLKATINFPAATAVRSIASMYVDALNNVHVTFQAGDGSIRYCLLTYSAGPTYSVGTIVTILGVPAAGISYKRIDITCVSNTATSPAVAVFVYNSNTLSSYAVVMVRNTAGTWNTHANFILRGTGQGVTNWSEDISISATHSAGGSTNAYACVATRKGANNDIGDVCWIVKVDPSVGTAITTVTVASGFGINMGSGYRNYWITGDAVTSNFTVAGTVSAAPWQMLAFCFSWNGTLATTAMVVPVSISPGTSNMTRTPLVYGWNSVAFTGSDGSSPIVFFAKNEENTYSVVAQMSATLGTVTWQPGVQFWDNRYKAGTGSVVPVGYIVAGSSSHTLKREAIICNMFYLTSGSVNAYRMEARGRLKPNAPDGLTPGNGSVVSTDRPTLGANFRLQTKYPQFRMKMEWNVATDLAFTTNVRTQVQDADDFKIPIDTAAPTLSTVKAAEVINAANEMYQQVWFIRARTMDEVGNGGTYSTASTSFTVSHPPAPANLSPQTGAILLYLAGSALFSWDFTDPSPYDFQTAYQIVVENDSTGATVADSGKVTSAAEQGTLTIPAGSKDVLLRWHMRLWDSDDVVGAFSDYRTFIISDPPAPSIINPVDGSTITTSIPFVGWNPGVGGIKTQEYYRASITTGSTEIMNTGWIHDNQNAYPVHSGILKNLTNYTVRVDVRDNLGLEGTDTNVFSTLWVYPSAPLWGIKAWTYYYNRLGYVVVTWDAEQRDVDFSAWNVYRRKVGESWELLASVTSGSPFQAYRDYSAGAETTYEYTVTQVVNRQGDVYESFIAGKPNMILNPGFEVDTSGWVTTASAAGSLNAASTSIIRVADTTGAGSWSAQVVTPGVAQKEGVNYDFTGNFKPNTTYTLTGFVRTVSGRPIRIVVYDVVNNVVSPTFYNSIASLTQVTVDITTGPLVPNRFIVAATTDTTLGATTFRIDELTLRPKGVDYSIAQVTPQGDHYWLYDKTNNDYSMPLYLVKSDAFTEEYDEAEFTIIGRGKHVDIGERLGYSGSLTAQLRDKFVTGLAKFNYILNPALSYRSISSGAPDGWTVTTNNVAGDTIIDWIETETPAPTGRSSFRIYNTAMDAQAITTLNFIQTLTGDNIPAAFLVPSTAFALTAWCYCPTIENLNKRYKMQVDIYSTLGALIGSVNTGALDPATGQFETWLNAGDDSLVNPVGQWRRFRLVSSTNGFAPTTGSIKITITLLGANNGAAAQPSHLTLGGVQLETGSASPYFDGSALSAEWYSADYMSWSLTTGYLTARKQRLALEKLKARKSSIYMRNPFGDVWTVMPGNINISRIAGVATNEFADAEIPYREVDN